jgi:hypothetical protein
VHRPEQAPRSRSSCSVRKRTVYTPVHCISFMCRVVNVVLTRCSTATVLPEFAQCLSQLPNLHTLQVVHAHSQMTTVLGQYFKDIKLPSVRLAILPAHAHNILRSCTEVRTVVCTEGESSKLVGAIRSSCPNVEIIRGFHFNVVQMKGQSPHRYPSHNMFSILV